ncbi:MAG TPA: FxLYD domain-containing protein [Pyrinomonadaceae bacterium]
MPSLNDTDSHPFEVIETAIKRDQSPIVKIVSIILALAVTAGLSIGYLIWRKNQAEKVAVEQQSQTKTSRPALPVKAQVFMDDAIRKDSKVTISGTVQNVSNEKLSNVVVDLELMHRKDSGTDVQSLKVDPGDLAPTESGKYSLTLTGDYRSIKLLRIKAGAQAEEVGFKTAQGAKRPAEHPPETKTIIVDKPSAPKKGEEFINTPDNPSKIP